MRTTDAVLEALLPSRVIVFGMAMDVCVDHAVQGLLRRGAEVFVEGLLS